MYECGLRVWVCAVKAPTNVRRTYEVEAVGAVIIFLYAFAYLSGRKTNENIATAWCVPAFTCPLGVTESIASGRVCVWVFLPSPGPP